MAFLYPHLPAQGYPIGARIGSTVVLPAGGAVHFLRSTGPADYDPPELAGRIFSTLNDALGQCRANKGDTVYALPGHTEVISAADQMSNLVAGTKIMGVGVGNERPTFTWTAATSTFLFDVANVTISNCILLMDPGAGTVNVAAPITVSAAGCGIYGCLIRMGTDVNSKVTIGVTTTAAADELTISGNHVYGATAAEATTLFQLVGADRLVMEDNYIAGATSSTAVGVVRFATTPSLDIRSKRNTFINRKALSTAAVTGLAAVSGESREDHFAYLDTSSLTPWLTSTGIMTFHRPTVTNTAGETGTEVVGVVSA